MANIQQELAAIMAAVYGEQVRSSIHNAIEKINDVSEVVLTTGTLIDSPTSPTTGFFDGSLYLNNDTKELWKCTGNAWVSQGFLKGDRGEDGENGNRWFRGQQISAESLTAPIDANENDNYLNTAEGKIYHCTVAGNPSTWVYDMTLTGGGGGGGTSDYAELDNKPQINNKTLNAGKNTLTASDVSAVPTTRKVNNKPLSADISLTASDVGALPNTTTIPTVTDTYSASSSNAMSGKAVAQALQNVQVTTDTNFSTTSNNPLKNKSVTKVLSDLYSSSKTYNAGDMCIYNDTLWKKIGASESGITPTAGTSWTACNIANEISAVNSNLVTFPDFANPTTVCSMQATSPSGGIEPFGVYTAEKTGFLYVDVFSPNNRNEWGTLKINGVSVLPGWSTGANVGFLSMYLVKQGDIIEVVKDTGNPYRFRMVIY